jgi:hypothetical protein
LVAALLVFNSAKFSKKDFKAIRDVGNSMKAGDSDARIGRFGLGFTSGECHTGTVQL